MSEQKVSWFPVEIEGKQRRDVRCLSLAGRGLVAECQAYFMETGNLPEDVNALRRTLGCDEKEFRNAYAEAKGVVTEHLPAWENKRLGIVARIESLSERGKKGGRPPMSEEKPIAKAVGKARAKATPKPELKPQSNPEPNRLKTEELRDSSNEESSVAKATGEVEPSREPTKYELIEFVLWGRAVRLAQLGGEPVDVHAWKPSQPVVKSHLTGSTGLLPVIERLGPYDTIDVLFWVARHMSPSTGYLKVSRDLDVILGQMKHGQDWVTKNRATQQGSTPDLRGAIESDIW